MFNAADLALRRAAALLPSRAGYALTQRLTPIIGGESRAWIGSRAEEKACALLGSAELSRGVREGFVTEIACDDLDALTATRWPEHRRLAATRVVGGENLPAAGPAVVTSFHFSGGFRVFDVLRARGLRPTFLHAPPRERLDGYAAAMHHARARYFETHLAPPFIPPGAGARDRLDDHLQRGGVVVALLDVAPATLELRDHAPCTLFGRRLRLPVGMVRLAIKNGAPLVPFDGRIEGGLRVLELHAPVLGDDPETLLARTLETFEGVIRARPWAWQSWLDVDGLFANAAASQG